MDTSDPAYLAGKLVGAPLFAGLIVYLVIRVFKKRQPTTKEKWVIVIAVVALFLLGLVLNAVKPSGQ